MHPLVWMWVYTYVCIDDAFESACPTNLEEFYSHCLWHTGQRLDPKEICIHLCDHGGKLRVMESWVHYLPNGYWLLFPPAKWPFADDPSHRLDEALSRRFYQWHLSLFLDPSLEFLPQTPQHCLLQLYEARDRRWKMYYTYSVVVAVPPELEAPAKRSWTLIPSWRIEWRDATNSGSIDDRQLRQEV